MPRAEAQRPIGGLALLIHCLVAASLVGCGGGHPAARNFDSREVLPLRDATLSIWSFTEKTGEPTVIALVIGLLLRLLPPLELARDANRN